MMIASTSMPTASAFSQPDVVADRVLRRAELGKMARRLQNRLALAQFKTRHGWEDLTLDMIEPKVEDEIRRKRGSDGDMLSDSSSNTSDLPYPSHRGLMSSPMKAPVFSDAIGSSNGSTGHRKRTYVASFDDIHHNRLDSYPLSSPSKRFRSSPPPSGRHVSGPAVSTSGGLPVSSAPFGARSYLPASQTLSGHAAWKDQHKLAHSSPIKPRRQQHFSTVAGPDVALFPGTARIADALASANYNAPPSDDDDDLLPTHSFRASSMALGPPAATVTSGAHGARAGSPPSTPPMRTRGLPAGNGRRKKKANGEANEEGAEPSGKEEGADLLLYLAASPSPANPSGRSRGMEPPSTPPSKFSNLALPSSMMTTPGGGSMFPNTPGQTFDFADFVNITPSPAQKPWKTPNLLGAKTPLSVARRRLTFDDPL